MGKEPILRPEDLRLWEIWQKTALVHGRSRAFQKHLDAARRIVEDALSRAPRWCLMWSGGKDSTVLTHLVAVEMGHALPVASEKDDLDFPGEEEYVTRLAATWGLSLTILRPPISPSAWIQAHGHEFLGDEDMHSRAAGLSKACFYGLVEEHTASYDGVFLGLRARESRGRSVNRATHGTLYQKTTGQWVATPLADWTGLDVMAYLASRQIPVLDVYRCIAFMHANEPWRVRKSWWIPGSHATKGGAAWLRHYYPSLFQRLCDWIPGAKRLG